MASSHCLFGHTSLGPKAKGLCANTSEGSGQVKLVELKNITLPTAITLLILHSRVLTNSRLEQLLTAVNDKILCVHQRIVLQAHTGP